MVSEIDNIRIQFQLDAWESSVSHLPRVPAELDEALVPLLGLSGIAFAMPPAPETVAAMRLGLVTFDMAPFASDAARSYLLCAGTRALLLRALE